MEEAGKSTILRVLQIVTGKSPIPHGAELIAPGVVIHMDEHTFSGINTWANWISYIQTRGRVAEFDVEVASLVTGQDGTFTARGRWKAQRNGQVVFSRDLWARYRVVDGVIVEIWTTRTNYSFLVGPLMDSRTGHLLVMLHVYLWAKRFGVRDLRLSDRAAAPVPSLHAYEEAAAA